MSQFAQAHTLLKLKSDHGESRFHSECPFHGQSPSRSRRRLGECAPYNLRRYLRRESTAEVAYASSDVCSAETGHVTRTAAAPMCLSISSQKAAGKRRTC